VESSAFRSTETLTRVVRVDRAVWNDDRPGSVQERNQAVAAAVCDGWTEQEIAHELGVMPHDVYQWITGEGVDLR